MHANQAHAFGPLGPNACAMCVHLPFRANAHTAQMHATEGGMHLRLMGMQVALKGHLHALMCVHLPPSVANAHTAHAFATFGGKCMCLMRKCRWPLRATCICAVCACCLRQHAHTVRMHLALKGQMHAHCMCKCQLRWHLHMLGSHLQRPLRGLCKCSLRTKIKTYIYVSNQRPRRGL